MKKAIILGIIVCCVGLTCLYPYAMISPGELTNGHQDLNKKCLSCHTAFSGISDSKCISCHKLSEIGKDILHRKDTSSGRFKILFHQYLSTQECASCHTDHKGLKPDVSLSDFKHELLSAVVANECGSCHNKPTDNLHKLLSVSCNSCHETNSWKLPAKFNHDMILGVNKSNCTWCHQKPADEYHLLLTANCDKCHSTSQWKPSTFDHSSYFRLDGNHNAKCNTCHSNNNFSTYTCYGCHEHSESSMLSKHNEEGIYNISNCVSCHKSGNEHDTKENGELDKNGRNNIKDYIRSKDENKATPKEKDDD